MMFRKNSNTVGVMNGALATIENISGEHITVVLDNGQRFIFGSEDYRKFSLGYTAAKPDVTRLPKIKNPVALPKVALEENSCRQTNMRHCMKS